MRHVIVHYHIFKNAGSSIDLCLSDSFGAGWHNFDVDEEWGNITSSDLCEHISEHPGLQAVSSHQTRWPEPSGEDLRTHPIVFLRHPIDRVGSIYSFAVYRGDPGVEGHSLAQYVDRLLDPASGWLARSFQTLFLSDDDHLVHLNEGEATQASDAHFDQAIARLERLPSFGMVERFHESISVFSRRLTPFFPNLVLVQRRANASVDREATLLDRLHATHEALGERRYQRLLIANEADMDLWNRAGRLFEAKERDTASVPVSSD